MAEFKISNVKSILATGLLEGVSVTYAFEKHSAKLHGIIRGDMYQCGCSSCNYTQVLTANEFERHAGAMSSHPNNHIFLENGKSLHEVVKHLAGVPFKSLRTEIELVTGCRKINSNAFGSIRDESSQPANYEARQRANHEVKQYEINSNRSEDTSQSSLPSNLRFVQKTMNEDPTHTNLSLKNPTACHKKEGEIVRKDRFNVKMLLSTGILEGLPVKYKKDKVELHGFIKDKGYLCGCSSCNYSEVVTALKFEIHAGATSHNQNNYIFLEDRISLYALVKELVNVPLDSLGVVIEEKIGRPVNVAHFKVLGGSFQPARHDLVTSEDNARNQRPHVAKNQSEPHLVIRSHGGTTEGCLNQSSFMNESPFVPVTASSFPASCINNSSQEPAAEGNFFPASCINISSQEPAAEGNFCPDSCFTINSPEPVEEEDWLDLSSCMDVSFFEPTIEGCYHPAFVNMSSPESVSKDVLSSSSCTNVSSFGPSSSHPASCNTMSSLEPTAEGLLDKSSGMDVSSFRPADADCYHPTPCSTISTPEPAAEGSTYSDTIINSSVSLFVPTIEDNANPGSNLLQDEYTFSYFDFFPEDKDNI